jgi:hypothetical protein
VSRDVCGSPHNGLCGAHGYAAPARDVAGRRAFLAGLTPHISACAPRRRNTKEPDITPDAPACAGLPCPHCGARMMVVRSSPAAASQSDAGPTPAQPKKLNRGRCQRLRASRDCLSGNRKWQVLTCPLFFCEVPFIAHDQPACKG